MRDDVFWRVIERLRKEVERSFLVRAGLEGRSRAQQIKQLQKRLKHESSIRWKIDDFFRSWISTGRWRGMSSDEALHVCDRFEHSVDFAAWLHQAGFRAFEKTESDLLAFFLIENWPGYGLKRMRSRLLALLWEN